MGGYKITYTWKQESKNLNEKNIVHFVPSFHIGEFKYYIYIFIVENKDKYQGLNSKFVNTCQ